MARRKFLNHGYSRVLLIPIALSLAGCPVQYPPPASPTEIRVVSYNTHHFGKHHASFPDGEDANLALADIAQMNLGLKPDVWLFQELYQSLETSLNPYPTDHVARIKAKLPGYEAIFSPYVTIEGSFSKGNALFWNTEKFVPVGAPISKVWQVTGLDTTKGGVGRILRRLSDSKEFLVVGVHFAASGVSWPRTKQAKEAVWFFSQALEQNAPLLSLSTTQIPWIFGGDLNTVYRTSEGAYKYLVNEVGMVPSTGSTVMTHKSGLHLDYVMTKGMTVVEGNVRFEVKHSDHYPVFARFNYPSY